MKLILENEDSIRGALARGYCTERNEKKVLDPDLIEDMAKEVNKFLPSPVEIESIIFDGSNKSSEIAIAISKRIRR